MSTKERALHEAPRKKRPSIFWWTLAHLLAIAFAATAWIGCLYVFKHPEKPVNYEILRWLGRITPVTNFDPLEAPEGTPAGPKDLYQRFFPQADEDLDAFNLKFRRNYIRNYADSDPRFTLYVQGDFVVESVSLLEDSAFFHPGLKVRAQALVRPDELSDPGPYPVHLDLMLPVPEPPAAPIYAEGDILSLEHIAHRAALLHASRMTTEGDPAVLVIAAPLAYVNYRDGNGQSLSLAAPAELNLEASFLPSPPEKAEEN